MENNNSCRNCRFFKPHYAQNDDGEMYMLGTGHCENPHIHIMQFKRGFKNNTACNYWQAVKDEQPKVSINDIIKNMATRIEQIATYLNIK
ncbi:MAG: hypothetical protein K2J01_06425 [Clostridiales bacterium]|nr:hypothetical protein [Clostridiales bacterium]